MTTRRKLRVKRDTVTKIGPSKEMIDFIISDKTIIAWSGFSLG
jgi:hypothetical protein